MSSSSDIRASLLDLGFSLSHARAAIAAGNTTIEAATEWLFANSGNSPQTNQGAKLSLRSGDDEAFEQDLQQAIEASRIDTQVRATPLTPSGLGSSSSLPDTNIQSQVSGESGAKRIKINIVRAQPSETTQPAAAAAALPPAPAASAPMPTPAPAPVPATVVSRGESIITSPSGQHSVQSGVLPTPQLTSRHKDDTAEAQHAARLAEANRRAEKARREKKEANLARQRTLDALKEDRENRKLRSHAVPSSATVTGPSIPPAATAGPSSGASAPPSSESKKQTVMVQLRLKNGSVVKRAFDSNATIEDLFNLARSEDGNVGSADISLIQPFPRKEFTIADNLTTLDEAGLCPSCSLNVLVQTPIHAPKPIAPITPTMSTPGGWLSPGQEVEMEAPTAGPDVDDTYMVVDGEEYHALPHHQHATDGAHHTLPPIPLDEPMSHEEENDEEDEEAEGEDAEAEEEEEDGMMHALPVPPAWTFQGQHWPGRGRGRGRGGAIAFTGQGHSLAAGGSGHGGTQPPPGSVGVEGDTPAEGPIAEEGEATRRERVLAAMANRAKAQEEENEKSLLEQQDAKPKEREIPSLQSLCSYEVAVLITASDSKSAQCLKLLGENVGNQATESIVQELIKLEKLDQLTLKKLFKCPIVSMVLDGYSRATDSLMDTIGASQTRSLSYLSLRGYLSLLTTLRLSQTKVTSTGMARIIAESSWKSSLHTLDLSYCEGVSGSMVLLNLEELTNLQMLHLNNTLAFDRSPIRQPSKESFSRLISLDLSRTPISSDDLVILTGCIPTLKTLNLTSCLRNLSHVSFPSREHSLLTVMPTAAGLPLTNLDFSGFVFVTDEVVLALESVTTLQILSLAGTKLTDRGSVAFTRMASLKELSLDRTNIGDKTMGYLRDLGRLEVLSMNRCRRLTTEGVIALSKCAFFGLVLKRLSLGYNKYIHDEALTVFVRCLGLSTLNLEHTDVSEQKALFLQNSLENLKQLRIKGVTNGAVYEEEPNPVFPDVVGST
ncbi:hypothetical protein BGW38_010756 [Lunasporangiospora selenospora]|uniref:UBX domain-containing protein n=1 Tax=Lunasporangiospora selenospora TaxID=979761 RepID=A0A9P6KFB1_9FUNG|nr:hypothetical protein BGW38_010756 [Lunasporangiospora selenospora]